MVRSGAIVSSMTFISRILGFIRDQVFAILFGAGPMTDAFVVAYKIPNLFRRLFGEGAFAQAFVPVFTEYKEKRDAAALRDLAAHVSGTLGGILLVLTTAGVAGAPLVILLFAPGFVKDANHYALAVDMLRYSFPYLFFISLTAYAGAILNTHGKFAVPAITPVLLNICLISAALFFSDNTDPPIMAVAIGIFVAGVVQLAFQIPFLMQLNLLPKPRWKWRHSGVQRVFKLMLPAMFGSSVSQLSILLDTVLASFLVAGSVTWLYFSDRLVEFPLGVFGIALATVILPRLSQQHAQNAPEAFNQTIDVAIRLGLIISLPSTLGLVMLASPMLTTLFQYGEFSAHDTLMSARSLTAYSLALPGFVMIKLLAPGFFARQDTRTPVQIGIRALFFKMLLSISMIAVMIYYGYDSPHVGLALATALFAWIHAAMLFSGLRKQSVYTPLGGWRRFFGQIGLALIAMGLLIFSLLPEADYWSTAAYWQRGSRLFAIIISAASLYVAVLYFLGLRPRHFKH